MLDFDCIAAPEIVDPEVDVTIITGHGDGVPGKWSISQNLSDRWGEFNYHNQHVKPLEPLLSDPELMESLRAQMCEEDSFIVRKDGTYGILCEFEFVSQESESDDPEAGDYKPYAEVVRSLISAASELALTFPQVHFAIPASSEIIHGRPAVWAYFPHNGLSEDERKALFEGLYGLL